MIRFSGFFNNTGYGIAARDTAYAMIKQNMPLTVLHVPTRDQKDSSSHYQKVVDSYIDKKLDYKINLTQIIPQFWDRVFEKGKYNIGYFFWETDRLCTEWVNKLNSDLTNEIWVPCEYNKQACLNSGVTKPIYVVPQCTTLATDDASVDGNIDFGSAKDAFKFYSIFQWTERKNGDGLVRAYLKEFNKEDDVLLVLKTYRFNTGEQEQLALKNEIAKIKAVLNKPEYPPIYFIGKNLPAEMLKLVHVKSDCYVTANRGEGWSMPIAEAMAVNKPVVTTQIGGITEMLDDSSAYIIPHEFEQVSGMPWIEWYTPDQQWGKINDDNIAKAMRLAFNDRKDFSQKISKYPSILKSVDIEAVGKIINDRINEIMKDLK